MFSSVAPNTAAAAAGEAAREGRERGMREDMHRNTERGEERGRQRGRGGGKSRGGKGISAAAAASKPLCFRRCFSWRMVELPKGCRGRVLVL